MIEEKFEIIPLKSGSNSLRLLDNNETFHPVIGPVAEAKILHIDQQKLQQRCQKPGSFYIWDVGLGAAANAIGAVEALQNTKATVELHSFDRTLDPLLFAIQHAEDLDYILPHRDILDALIKYRRVQLTPNLSWHFHLGDFRDEMHRPELPSPHAVFYDPYSAKGNQEMWNLEHFAKLHQRLDPDRECLLTNYTRSTAIRATWLLAGFYVGIGTAIGEKEETTIAAKHRHTLDEPLPKNWLKNVKTSQNANPLRGNSYYYGPISVEDFQSLEQHPQFHS